MSRWYSEVSGRERHRICSSGMAILLHWSFPVLKPSNPVFVSQIMPQMPPPTLWALTVLLHVKKACYKKYSESLSFSLHHWSGEAGKSPCGICCQTDNRRFRRIQQQLSLLEPVIHPLLRNNLESICLLLCCSMRQKAERMISMKIVVAMVEQFQEGRLQECEGVAMQRGHVVETKAHKQTSACSLRSRWKHTHLQAVSYVTGKASM